MNSEGYFTSVLTSCCNCKKSITVECEYKNRNKFYKCEDCNNIYFKGYKNFNFFNV